MFIMLAILAKYRRFEVLSFWDNMYYDFDLLKDFLHKYSLS